MAALDLVALFNQHARLIEIKTPLPDASLIVERFNGREAISESFRFEIDCVSTNAFFQLKPLLGEEITLKLRQADGSLRAWHGYVTHAAQLGADGGLARYRLVMESFLAFLGQRRDCYLFQDGTCLDFMTKIFADYPEIDWQSQVTQKLRRYSLSTQYRETDLDFLLRLLGEEGLSFHFEHDRNAQAGDDAKHARHKLIVIDRDSELPAGRQATLRFHRRHATEATDTVQQWQEVRQVEANAVSLAGWDYKTLTATGAQSTAVTANGELPSMEVYDASQPYRFEDSAAAQLRTDLAMSACEARYRRFRGAGSVRQLAAGTRIALTGHDGYAGDDAHFKILAVDHRAANNLGSEAARLLRHTDIEAGTYRNTCLAQAASAPIVGPNRPKPAAQPQSAQVVGLADSVVHTDRDHRIQIQFPWQRGSTPNPGGLTETGPSGRTAGKTGHAPGNEQSGTWVRVAEWLAGPNWGSHFLPRVGSEVLVDFLGGDIDRPIVVGQLYNGADLPPFAAGHRAAANHPGVLTGWMSHNHPGEGGSGAGEGGYNQWLIDDAPGQLRTRLATAAGASQLGLGHLIHQPPASAHRGAWRGSGFELRTDGWLAIRAGEGLLISATARPNAQSTQMDVAETVGQLQAAEQTAQTLSDAAQHQHALPLQANAAQSAFIKAIDPQQDGQYTGRIGGQEAKKAQAGSRNPGEPTERFAQALILAEAPGDIGHSSPASTLLFAGGHLHATVQQDAHLAGAHTAALAVGRATSWFAHAGGIKSIAQAGSQSIQAHGDALELLADQSVTVTSTNDEIHIQAKDKIVLQAGQSSVTLEGGNITFACPGTFSVKGSGNAFLEPASSPAQIAGLPAGTVSSQAAPVFSEALYNGQYELFKTDNRPFDGYDYEIRSNRSGKLLASGKTDAAGLVQRITTTQEESLSACKAIKRESERIAENWLGKLTAAASRAAQA